MVSVVPQNRLENEMTWGTHRDLTACFTWKQVGICFSVWPKRLTDARRYVVHVAPLRRSRENQVEDGRVDTTDCVGP
jgi:hypothetical protein